MQPLYRQGSNASSDTFASCCTHPQNSPLIASIHCAAEPNRQNVYVNPINEPPLVCPPNSVIVNDRGTRDLRVDNAFRSNNLDAPNHASDQIVQSLDEGYTTTWRRADSPTSLCGEFRSRSHSKNEQHSVSSPKSPLKRHKSLSGEKHPRFADLRTERTYYSSDNIYSKCFAKPKMKFRKASSLANRLHISPATGKKLAHYRMISNSKSGKYFCMIYLRKC